MLRGYVVAAHEHAADAALDVDRSIAVGPPHILAPAVARDRHQTVLVPCRSFAGHDIVDLRPDNIPNLRPALAPALPQPAGVTLRSQGPPVCVVVELDQVRAPPD